jgi:hypothetical protein
MNLIWYMKNAYACQDGGHTSSVGEKMQEYGHYKI